MSNTNAIQSENYVEGFRGWNIAGGNIEINPSLFMVGIAYKYHALENEDIKDFTDRLMTNYDLERPVEVESKLCDLSKRDEIIIPGCNDPEALNRLHEVVKNLEL